MVYPHSNQLKYWFHVLFYQFNSILWVLHKKTCNGNNQLFPCVDIDYIASVTQSRIAVAVKDPPKIAVGQISPFGASAMKDFRIEAKRRKAEVKAGKMAERDFIGWLLEQRGIIDELKQDD